MAAGAKEKDLVPVQRSDYTSSPLESVFDQEIQERFQLSLGSPMVVSPEPIFLRRTSLPYRQPDSGRTLVFQYTRFNILNQNNLLAEVYRRIHPEEVIEIDEDDPWKQMEKESEQEEAFEDLVKGIKAGQSPAEKLRALIDPNYSFEGVPIQEWHEQVEFTVFEESADGPFIDGYGMIAAEADLLARISTRAGFSRGITLPATSANDLHIFHPKLDQVMSRASLVVFGHQASGAIALPFVVGEMPPKELMGRIGAFTENLVAP